MRDEGRGKRRNPSGRSTRAERHPGGSRFLTLIPHPSSLYCVVTRGIFASRTAACHANTAMTIADCCRSFSLTRS